MPKLREDAIVGLHGRELCRVLSEIFSHPMLNDLRSFIYIHEKCECLQVFWAKVAGSRNDLARPRERLGE